MSVLPCQHFLSGKPGVIFISEKTHFYHNAAVMEHYLSHLLHG